MENVDSIIFHVFEWIRLFLYWAHSNVPQISKNFIIIVEFDT